MQSQYKKEYKDYINSSNWKQKRKLVIERCGNKCEGCRLKNVEDVHHVTYKNFGDEFLFELLGLCKQCHLKIHKDDKKSTNPCEILIIKDKEILSKDEIERRRAYGEKTLNKCKKLLIES